MSAAAMTDLPKTRKPRRRRPAPAVNAKMLSSKKGYFYTLHLWDSRDEMVKELDGDAEGTQAVTVMTWAEPRDPELEIRARKLLGNMHFAKGHWSIEVVAHEVTHAILHRGRLLPPNLGSLINTNQELEEVLAYEHGEWTQAVFCWLREHDPAHHWSALPMNRDPAQIICTMI